MKKFFLLALLFALTGAPVWAQNKVVKRRPAAQNTTPHKSAAAAHGQKASPTTPAAQFNLGKSLYRKGKYAEALKWLRLAAESGHAEAQDYMGEAYQYGRGVEQDLNLMEQWYKRSAENGCARGQHDYGLVWETRKYNTVEAAKWYRKAAVQGNQYSQYRLGLMLTAAGEYAEAAQWYRKAAVQGYAPAQCSLAACYENGQGVTQSRAEASKWYRRAAKNGDYAAKSKIEKEGF